MSVKWLTQVIASVVLVSLAVVGIAKFVPSPSTTRPITDTIEALELESVLQSAHQHWGEDRSGAISEYKRVLRGVSAITASRDHPVFRLRQLQQSETGLYLELSTVFRRVIDHEAEYGDPAEARDWCVRAWNDWNLDLSLSSNTANQIWREVQSELGDTGQPVWKRVLNQ